MAEKPKKTKESKADKPEDMMEVPEQSQPSAQQRPQGQPGVMVGVIGQYVKDLSFENPHSPLLLLQMKEKPKFNVGVDVRANKTGDDIYEVILMLQCRADVPNDPEKRVLFIAELAYTGVFRIQGVPENQIEQMLLIYCPGMLFPFARRVIADATRDGGMPPLLLDPIDFMGLYNQRKAQGGAAA